MSEGQWRVFVLLLVLLFMEVLRLPALHDFFTNLAFNPFKQAVS